MMASPGCIKWLDRWLVLLRIILCMSAPFRLKVKRNSRPYSLSGGKSSWLVVVMMMMMVMMMGKMVCVCGSVCLITKEIEVVGYDRSAIPCSPCFLIFTFLLFFFKKKISMCTVYWSKMTRPSSFGPKFKNDVRTHIWRRLAVSYRAHYSAFVCVCVYV